MSREELVAHYKECDRHVQAMQIKKEPEDETIKVMIDALKRQAIFTRDMYACELIMRIPGEENVSQTT